MGKDHEVAAKLLERLNEANAKDWRLDEDVLRFFGNVRRVSRLGMNGRSPGSYRYFGPNANPFGVGSALPPVTKDEKTRAKWAKKLAARAHPKEPT